jgi:DNA-binding transcriptional LysR family regulator
MVMLRPTAERASLEAMHNESGADWESVHHFLVAAESRSLSGAARRLDVEHTTVGRRIATLERAVGALLVVRGPKGLELTPVGEHVFRLASEMATLARAIHEVAIVERTNVRLVMPTGFTSLLTPELEALRRDQPRILLEIVSGARRVDVRKGEADLALRIGPIDDEQLVARKLAEVGSALYGSRAYLARHAARVDPDDLAGHSLVGFHRSLSDMPAATWLAARSAHATVVMRSREAADMLAAAESGAGLAVLPCFLGDAAPSLVRLTPEPIGLRKLSLVYRRESRLAPEFRAVVAFLSEVVRHHAKKLRG